MKKILFLIHDLGQGGAEKVLVNLVNHMDSSKFDITVIALFGGGINEQFLKPHIKYKTVFPKEIPGNSKLMKLLTPEQLHRLCVKETYDIEVSYLEGPSARVISGCKNVNTKLVSWIHIEQHSKEKLAKSFRSFEEASKCYNKFHQTICVSEFVKKDFSSILEFKKPCDVLYNTVESDQIISQSKEKENQMLNDDSLKLIAVGTLKESKGYDRLLRIIKRLVEEHFKIHLYILGMGPLEQTLKQYVAENELNPYVTFLGYDTNPYKYVAKSDLFLCSSHAEGFSTAATEALIVGTPVCTVNVSGMKEMLGEKNEFGVVTENTEEALYEGIKKLILNPILLQHYSRQALKRGELFSSKVTTQSVQKLFDEL